MSKAAVSMLVFGIYLAANAVLLMVAPLVFLGLFGMPATDLGWVRVVGILAAALAFFYIQSARKGVEEFFRWTLVTRCFACAAFLVLAFGGLGPRPLALFGLVDLAGAAWTALALRKA